jgi:uncharacterized damage-inducible protein DinB
MELAEHFRRQLEYDHWANREVFSSLKAVSGTPAGSVRLLAHVIAAEGLWLARMTQSPAPLPVWPELPLDDCGPQIAKSYSAFVKYFDGELPFALDRDITYQNSKGESWTSRVDDILTHVFAHSAYHRGQIALLMRQAGYEPAYTDFIHGVRQGLVK